MLADTAILPARCTIGRPHLNPEWPGLGLTTSADAIGFRSARGELDYADENGGEEAAF